MLEYAGSRYRIPDTDKDTVSRYQIRIPDTDSRYGYRTRIADTDTGYGYLLIGYNSMTRITNTILSLSIPNP